MSTPKYIRVAGQLFRRRASAHPEFLVRSGYVYRKAKTGEENVAAIDALKKLGGYILALAKKIKAADIQELLKSAYKELNATLGALVGSDRDKAVDAVSAWSDIKGGLESFAGQLEKANQSAASNNLSSLLAASDAALESLKASDGLDVKEFSLPAKETPAVDWGEYAPKQQQQLNASTAPEAFFIFENRLYRPLLPLTKEARAWAKSSDPTVAQERTAFAPELIEILAAGTHA